MTVSKPLVIIKGVKDGLYFVLDEHAPFPEVIAELNHKLMHSHGPFLEGSLTQVHVRTGEREVTDELRQVIRESFSTHGNLLVRSIAGNDEVLPKISSLTHVAMDDVRPAMPPQEVPTVHLVARMVRSGEVIQHTQDILIVGDVNPGGIVISGGNIYVMGWLRGIAHAGYEHNTDKVIVATGMAPTQLRIGSIVTRAPEEKVTRQSLMEVAFAVDGAIHVTGAQHLGKLRLSSSIVRGG